MIVGFVDIGGIDDHNCLRILFIILLLRLWLLSIQCISLISMCEGVLFNANAAIHQLQLLWREQVNEMMLRFAWNYTNTLSVIFFFTVLSHWNNKPQIDMSLHWHTLLSHWNNKPWIDVSLHWHTLSWFCANHVTRLWSSFLMLCAKRKNN